ncbi:MAG: hypothetical protein ACE5JE_09330, partial [Thermoplasmata archaeon]
VFRGRDNGALQARLHDLSQQIEEEFGEMLASWAGTSSDVRPVKALLPLLWGKRKAREKRTRRKPVGVPEEPPEVPESQEEEGAVPEITVSAVRRARKADLRAWCLQLGLDDSGTVVDLRERLLHDLETQVEEPPSEAEAESGLPEDPVEEDLQEKLDESPEEAAQDDIDEAREEDSMTAIEADIGDMGARSDEMLAEGPPDTPPETPEGTPETPSDEGDMGEVATPVVVLDEAEETVKKAEKRKKGRGKKAKRERKAKRSKEVAVPSQTEEPSAEEQPMEEEMLPDSTEISGEREVEPELEPVAGPPQESTGSLPELKVKQIWDAPRSKLQEWCRQYGLDDTGPIMNMRLRLLSRIEPA